MVAVAIGGAAVVGAGASISASNKASKTAKSTAASNNALQASIYDANKAALSPYESAGTAATEQLRRALGLGDSNTGVAVGSSPAYSASDQYKGVADWLTNQGPYATGLAEGQKSVTAALGAKGLLDSGAAQKSLLTYGQNYYKNYYDDYVGQLSALSGQGLSAASAQAGVGQGYANSVSNNNNTAANTTSNAALANAGTVNSSLGNLVQAYGYSQGLGSSYGGGAALRGGAYGVAGSDGIY